MSDPLHQPDQLTEINLSVDPDIVSAPGAGDIALEPTDPVATDATMLYTHGGTPCS